MTEYHEIYKIHLEHLVIPENKEVLKKKKKDVKRAQKPMVRAPNGQSYTKMKQHIWKREISL